MSVSVGGLIVWYLDALYLHKNENSHLRVIAVFGIWSFFVYLFVFRPCSIYLFKSYPYIMMAKRLCQHDFSKIVQVKNTLCGKAIYSARGLYGRTNCVVGGWWC